MKAYEFEQNQLRDFLTADSREVRFTRIKYFGDKLRRELDTTLMANVHIDIDINLDTMVFVPANQPDTIPKPEIPFEMTTALTVDEDYEESIPRPQPSTKDEKPEEESTMMRRRFVVMRRIVGWKEPMRCGKGL